MASRSQKKAAAAQAKAPAPAAAPEELAGFRPGLSAIERVRLARHPARPQTFDYIAALVRDFFEIHGDRRFGDDGAVIAGLGWFGDQAVAVVGQQRGRSTTERLRRNFGRPNPEGYRKACRVYALADKFHLPLLTFIDTQGAEPGVGAEERGQSEAIASSLELMARIETPSIACVIGEGGSGGALALGIANVVLIQENACYSVITPEGCAAIVWREANEENVARAAEALRLSAPDLLALGVVDEIVPEPPGGAHLHPPEAAQALRGALERNLKLLIDKRPAELRRMRERRFAAIGTAYLLPERVENHRPIG